ncbi:hypothetical protein GIB67_033453 [Kingdonia uniflora]|uniref:KIB1-4 beta-propeller domain-containing protein n=1 Tax=Kingdonia uniflora TaxID=39325 RepID=A0A7J7LU66_9MAGN|nr:hypothetical protein GIB67_033453 [Kingdonia uniflora]
MTNWADLPEELISLVGYHDLSDYFSFRGVCRAWRSVASKKHYFAGVSGYKFHWLMMAEKEDSDIRSFYSLSNKKFYNIHLPEDRGRRCMGSPHVYALDSKGILRICDVTSIEPKVVDFASPPEALRVPTSYILSRMWQELNGLSDHANDDDPDYYQKNVETYLFEFFELDLHTRMWQELNGLSDHTLFLGSNYLFSLSVSNYPELKRNCAYFTDNYVEIYSIGGGCNIGIYDFEDQMVEFIDLDLDMHSKLSYGRMTLMYLLAD